MSKQREMHVEHTGWRARQAKQLSELFPPHPNYHSVIQQITGHEKVAPRKYAAAGLNVYLEHLSEAAYSGIGALGMFLGQKTPDPNDPARSIWVFQYVVLDQDKAKITQVKALADTLSGFGIWCYLNEGTTGRGSHLFIFFIKAIPQALAYAFVRAIQRMASDAGLGWAEIRPTIPKGSGSPIFLPYRGAAKDGYGANALRDPSNDLDPIALVDAKRLIKRVGESEILALCDEVRNKTNRAGEIPFVFEEKIEPSKPESETNLSDMLTRFHAELERVTPYFVQGSRQFLILGVTAYAVQALGLEPDVVRDQVQRFIVSTDKDEYPQRLRAIERTLREYREGRPVAWRTFYERAGLQPPSAQTFKPIGKVLDAIVSAKELLKHDVWRPRTGNADRAAFAAVLEYAHKHAVKHELGFSVRVSTRELALKSGLSHGTLLKAIKRLITQGLIQRIDKRRGTESGMLAVVMSKVHKLQQSVPLPDRGVVEWQTLCTHPAFRHGRLNRSAIAPLAMLIATGRPLTRSELGKRLGKKSRTLRQPLEKLLMYEVVYEEKGRYATVKDWQKALDHAAEQSGALLAERQDKETYERQRESYRALVEAKRRK